MSLLGILVLNLLFLLAGSCLVWGVRGWSTWREYAMLGGVAYMSGLCASTVIATLVPIYGGDLSGGVVLLVIALPAVVGVAIGLAKRRPLPRRAGTPLRPESLATALMGLTAVMLALDFRVARIQPMTAWDAWAFWTTKAKAIYYFGGLDPTLFRGLWGPSYPLLVPVLDAMDFRFMGSTDTTVLAVQWWLLGVGLVWAAAGLLRRVAPPRITWLFLAIAVALPQFDDRLLSRTADWPLDIMFALAACSLLAWIVSDESWLLVVYGITLAAALVTKREGQLLAVCLVVAGLVAAGIRSRRTWPAVAGIAVLAYLPNVPWRIWWTSRGLPSDTPPGGLIHATFHNLGHAPAAFDLVARLLFEYHLWLAVVPIALLAAVVGLWLPDRRVAIFFLATFSLGFVGWAWENWAFMSPSLPISTNPGLNPTNRTVASLVLLSVVTAPVLVGRLLATREPVQVAVPKRAPVTT